MKTAYFALGTLIPLGFLIFFAASYPSTADAVQTAAATVGDLGYDDSIVFVEGDEAEPPALPEGLATPVASAPEGTAPAVKEVKYVTPETMKKLPGFRRVRAISTDDDTGAVTFDISPDAARAAFKRPAFRYNE